MEQAIYELYMEQVNPQDTREIMQAEDTLTALLKLVENQEEIAEALCRGVCRWFGVNYTVPAGEDWQQRYLSLRQSLQALLEENPAQI